MRPEFRLTVSARPADLPCERVEQHAADLEVDHRRACSTKLPSGMQLTPARAAAERYFTVETRLWPPLPFMFLISAARR
ncbi:MAG: hypothetical protein HYV63_03580 [Candidatus Schekmanbacteria bacterium]|nr:hypothetical protein [Candidatus Schekmanbacteria bacterium]